MILIIDNYDSFTYNLYQYVASNFNDEVRVVRNNMLTTEQIKQFNYDGIILSPGPGHPENAGICIELIQNCDPSTPILGVCLGHQAIACAFGGEVVSAPEIMHGKEDLIFHYRQGLYQNLPLPFTAGRYHSLIVNHETLPALLKIEAENSSGLMMGMRHVERPIYGVQFHPESILTASGEQFMQSFLKICRERRSFV